MYNEALLNRHLKGSFVNHPDFTSLRRSIDDAITYQDLSAAKKFAAQGLRLAEQKECLAEVMYFKAQRLIVRERFGEAVPFLKKALKYNPTDGAAYNDLALCLINLGIVEGVEIFFDKGIEVEPDYATIYHNKGWFLNNIGRPTEALALFQITLTLEPGRAVTYENMANAYESLGRAGEALEAYQKALACLPVTMADIRAQIEIEIHRLRVH